MSEFYGLIVLGLITIPLIFTSVGAGATLMLSIFVFIDYRATTTKLRRAAILRTYIKNVAQVTAFLLITWAVWFFLLWLV